MAEEEGEKDGKDDAADEEAFVEEGVVDADLFRRDEP